MAVPRNCNARCLFPRSAPSCNFLCALPFSHGGFCSCLHHLEDQHAPAAAEFRAGRPGSPPGRSSQQVAQGGTPRHTSRRWTTLDEMMEHTDAIGLHPNKAAKLWREEVRDAKKLAEMTSDEAKQKGLAADDWELVRNFGDANPCTSMSRTSRADHPIMAPTKRGSRADAKLALSTPAGRAAALSEIDDLVDAPSAHRNRTQRWETWCDILGAFGEDALPVTASKVRMVAAGLRAGGFRSAAPYFTTASLEHLKAYGHRPGPLVVFAASRYARAVTRGVGPSTLKESFLIEGLAGSMEPPASQRLPQDTLWPCAAACLGAWWMTRGIELSAARIKDVQLVEKTKVVYWKLPVSKTDVQAHGVSRAHKCICLDFPELTDICPFHLFIVYLDFVKEKFADLDDLADLPLFPNGQGGTLSHSATIRMVQTAALASGDTQAFDPRRFGEHALRVSGAQFLARCLSLEVYLIQLYGRWSSSAVARYVQNSPLTRTTSHAAQKPTSMNIDDIVKLVVEAMKTKQKSVDEAVDQLEKPENVENLRALKTEIKTSIAAASPPPPDRATVMHLRTKFTHLVLVGPGEGIQEEDYLSYCGWHFGATKHRFNTGEVDSEDRLCQKCFRHENCVGAGVSESDTDASASD